MKHFTLRYYFPIAIIVCMVGIVLVIKLPDSCNWEVLFTIVGGGLSSLYIAQRQKVEEVKLFKELFSEFNKRYDGMNEKLNNILKGDRNTKPSEDEIHTLNDYFNLCGEEYLYYKEGFIYEEVWRAWSNGMRIFFENPRIKKVWMEELETGSYYGLKLE